MALGKEHLQHLRFLRLAEIGAEQEEGERYRDADRDLVEPHELEADPLRQAVGNRAAAHREERDKKKSVMEQLKSQPRTERKKAAPKKSAEREI